MKIRVEDIESNKLVAIEELINGEWVTWWNEGEQLLERKEFKGIIKSTFGVRRRLFTGVLDRFGKEIYEGDILRIWIGNKAKYKTSVAVEFKNGAYFTTLENGEIMEETTRPLHYFISNNIGLEVVGNTYSKKI